MNLIQNIREAKTDRENSLAFKSALVDLAVEKLGPIGAGMKRLNSDPAYIDRVLVDGASRARAVASKNMAMVKDILGFVR